jgi:hypothetical protein
MIKAHTSLYRLMAPRPGQEVATLPALSLTNLGTMFSELGRPAAVMTADQEVVGIHRELAVAAGPTLSAESLTYRDMRKGFVSERDLNLRARDLRGCAAI